MKLNLIKTPNGDLRPATETDRAVVRRWTPGDMVTAEVKRPRSNELHAFYFHLLRMVHENSEWVQERWPDFETFRERIQMQAGYFEEVVNFSGKVSYRPKSVSYSSMDQDEFLDLVNKVKGIIIKHIWPNLTHDELDRMVEEFRQGDITA